MNGMATETMQPDDRSPVRWDEYEESRVVAAGAPLPRPGQVAAALLLTAINATITDTNAHRIHAGRPPRSPDPSVRMP